MGEFVGCVPLEVKVDNVTCSLSCREQTLSGWVGGLAVALFYILNLCVFLFVWQISPQVVIMATNKNTNADNICPIRFISWNVDGLIELVKRSSSFAAGLLLIGAAPFQSSP